MMQNPFRTRKASILSRDPGPAPYLHQSDLDTDEFVKSIGRTEQRIATQSAIESVGLGLDFPAGKCVTTAERIGSVLAKQAIRICAAVEIVGAAAAEELIFTEVAEDRIVPGVAVEPVVADAAVDGVGARAAL